MKALIHPGKLHGSVAAKPSKSDLHRALIAAALGEADRKILIPGTAPLSEDIEATIRCLTAAGARIRSEEENGDRVLAVCPADRTQKRGQILLDCGESGTTLRFLLPVLPYFCEEAVFTGRGRLPQRPLSPLIEEMEKNGFIFSARTLPLSVRYRGSGPQTYKIPGNVTSQYISGLLFAGMLADLTIRLTSRQESAGYVDMTVDTLRRMGQQVEKRTGEDGLPVYHVSPRSGDDGKGELVYRVEGGWSNAAFLLAAGAEVTGLRYDSLHRDRAVTDILERIRRQKETLSDPEETYEINVSDIPDLVPVIAVTAAGSAATDMRITGGARLRLKESDRIATTAAMIRALGGRAEELPDGLLIGKGGLRGGCVDGAGDHRIVMAAAVSSAFCKEDVEILGAEAVAKSYPDFWEDFRKAGGKVELFD